MTTKQIGIIVSIIIAIVILLFLLLRPKTITNYPSSGTDIVAFGDSLIQGVGSTNSNDFVSILSRKIGMPITNLGHSGDTTADGLARISDLDKYNPKIVILLLGGNDYLKKVPITETENNLATIIKNIQNRGAIVLLLGVRGGLINDHFDSMFERLRDQYHTAYVSDVLSGLIADSRYMSDAVHPNDVGYSIITERVYGVIKGLLK